MSRELWSRQYAANEAVWQSKDVPNARRQCAWRKQKLLLAQQTRDFSEATRYEVLREHQDKMHQDESTEHLTLERLKRCQQIIGNSRRSTSGSRYPELNLPKPSAFEPICRGFYKSCGQTELNTKDLQGFSFHEKAAPTEAERITAGECRAQDEQTSAEPSCLGFRTAREQYILNELKKNKEQGAIRRTASADAAPSEMMNFRKKTLGGKRSVSSNFVSPVGQTQTTTNASSANIPPSLAHLDPKMVEQILGESMHNFKNVGWDDIAGLESAKSTFLEAIIMPLRRPDLFTGVRCPPRGVLLFGPPGTGKTLIAKSIASQAKAKFFSINPSSLTSKWVGEAEKLVKTLFAVAAAHQPAIIFIDEVDSLLSKRSGNENESTLRLKNEFLIHLDGAASNEEARILVIGATNRPQELDEAVRRRFVRRLYVPLPTKDARQQIIKKIIRQVKHNLDQSEVEQLAELTEGYSGADVDTLCRYASMAPLRSLSAEQMEVIEPDQLPAVTMEDFNKALRVISKSVSAEDCQQFVAWNEIYGVRH
ncbi:fidgetin-like protein 1 isoform X2 [Drosophila kikkawai]|uniref:Fidgetin-like protein 1 isoform X2 n=1 Tax=Drosophila kikkawai TaxID=30033 RepID=A0A6P4JDE3_DROKI|nr:fidgetin-like protein 1 isoform X2 [Drosophila kikkawai]